MNKLTIALLSLSLTLFLTTCSLERQGVNILTSKDSTAFEKNATLLLKNYLTKIYPKTDFIITEKTDSNNPIIITGTVESIKKMGICPKKRLRRPLPSSRNRYTENLVKVFKFQSDHLHPHPCQA